MKITIVIHTYNEEKNLPYALESVKDFDEIIVCDMYSTDRTIEIAKEYGCKIIYFENTGFPEPARTYAIQSATHEWILTVDADEIVPLQLKNYLYEQIQSKDCPDGIKLPRKNYFMGKFMRSVYPDHILRFFRKEGTIWPPFLHSQPIVKGNIYTIPASKKELALIHIAEESIEKKINKMNLYSEKELQRAKNKNYNFLQMLVSPFFRFFKSYIIKGGIWDGKVGFIFAYIFAISKFTIIAKTWEKEKRFNDLENDIKNYKSQTNRNH